jgi:hypothetical protein
MSVSAIEDVPGGANSCDTVYAVHDEGLNDSQIVTIATDSFGNEVVQELGPLHSGLDIEGLDVRADGKIYGSSGDDTDKPGYLYEIDSSGILGEGVKICFDFPGDTGLALEAGLVAQVVCGREISSLSFNPADDTLWGWAEECGLIKIDPIPNATDPQANATLVLLTPNDGGANCLTENPSKVTPIVEERGITQAKKSIMLISLECGFMILKMEPPLWYTSSMGILKR